MPIKNISAHAPGKVEYIIGKDVGLSYCSESCLLKDINLQSRVVKTGQSDTSALTVIRDDQHLLVPIALTPRSPAHVLGAQSGMNTAHRNWKKLSGHKSSALMPVLRVCNCMAEVQILDGEPLEDASTTPAWKKVRYIIATTERASGRLPNKPYEFVQWCRWMGDLASGLDELEKRGLAHGDPYPFNAICSASGACWVDFGHMTDDPSQRPKDVWGFILFTVLHTLGKAGMYSPSLLERLADVLTVAEQPGAFNELRKIFSDIYSDLIPLIDSRSLSSVLADAFGKISRETYLYPDASKLLLRSSVQYFSALLHHINRSNQLFSGLHFERQRHYFLEQEMLRLTVPLAEHKKAVAERDAQIAERDAQITNMIHSRSWRYTRPLRAIARTVKHRKLSEGDSRAIYNLAARIGRKIPLPRGVRGYVRKALLKRLYPASPAEHQMLFRPLWRRSGLENCSMHPECCGLREGLVSVVLPVYNQSGLIAESIESVLKTDVPEL